MKTIYVTRRQPALTPTQRIEFLRGIGWTENMPAVQKAALEQEWTDEKIRMASELGF